MSEQTPFFSFLLPAYKATFLKEAIASILNQTYTRFELVIVNDASPQNLSAIVESFSDPRIRYYVNQKNIGGEDLAGQWNHCLEYARGDWVMMAADDDIYASNYLEEVNALIQKYPDISVVRGRVQRINEQGEITDIDICLNELLSAGNFLYTRDKIIMCMGNYAFKRYDLAKNGFIKFPHAWCSDWATVYKMAEKGIAVTHSPVYSFRSSKEHISAQTNTKIMSEKIRATSLYFIWLKQELDSLILKYNTDTEIALTYQYYFGYGNQNFFGILGLFYQVQTRQLFPLLKTAYKQKFISRREVIKIAYYYYIFKIFKIKRNS